MTTTATTPQQHLQTVINNWTHLRDMLDTHTSAPWPPAGRMTDYLAQLDAYDAAAARRSRTAPTELEVPAGQPPLNLDALDAIRTTELALLGTADHIASRVQRYPVTVDTGRGWTDPLHRQVALLAAKDQADPRRWSLEDGHKRSPVLAAVWLQHRLDNAPGPFRPLNTFELNRITGVAREAAARVERVLAIARQSSAVPEPCPHCRGRLRVEGGDGQPPAVRCTDCGWTRTDNTAAA